MTWGFWRRAPRLEPIGDVMREAFAEVFRDMIAEALRTERSARQTEPRLCGIDIGHGVGGAVVWLQPGETRRVTFQPQRPVKLLSFRVWGGAAASGCAIGERTPFLENGYGVTSAEDLPIDCHPGLLIRFDLILPEIGQCLGNVQEAHR